WHEHAQRSFLAIHRRQCGYYSSNRNFILINSRLWSHSKPMIAFILIVFLQPFLGDGGNYAVTHRLSEMICTSYSSKNFDKVSPDSSSSSKPCAVAIKSGNSWEYKRCRADHGTSDNIDDKSRFDNFTSTNEDERLLKASASEPHSFPYLVYVKGNPGTKRELDFQGVIYNQYTIITSNKYKTLEANYGENWTNTVRIQIGKHSVSARENTEQLRYICNITENPKDSSGYSYALIHLYDPILFNDFVMASPLLQEYGIAEFPDQCMVAAWGRNETSRYQDVLHESNVSVSKCENKTLKGCLTTKKQHGVYSYGDSGAVLVCSKNSKAYVRGVLVFSGSPNAASPNYYIDFNRPDFIEWVEAEYTKHKELCRPELAIGSEILSIAAPQKINVPNTTIKPSDMFITSEMISVLILLLMWQSQLGTCPNFAITNRYLEQLCKAYSDNVFGKVGSGPPVSSQPCPMFLTSGDKWKFTSCGTSSNSGSKSDDNDNTAPEGEARIQKGHLAVPNSHPYIVYIAGGNGVRGNHSNPDRKTRHHKKRKFRATSSLSSCPDNITGEVNPIYLRHLYDPITYNQFVGSATLFRNDSSMTISDDCVVSSWGSDNSDIYPTILNEVDVTVIDDCSQYGEDKAPYLCTPKGIPNVYCHGDLGSPLVCSKNGKSYIRGLSAGDDRKNCNKNVPAFFTHFNKPKTIEWIESEYKNRQEMCRPDY
ncbi:unnamed protein product, partial [Allacma fusca]